MVSDMEVIMAVDMEVMVSDSDTEAMDMPDTTWARDPLMPSPKLMPDICMEDMVLAMVAMDTDVDTDTVLDTPVDTDTVLVDTEATAMVCGEDKHSAHFPLRAFIQKLPITNYLFKDFSSTDKESVPHICGE